MLRSVVGRSVFSFVLSFFVGSELPESIHLDDERAILQAGKAGVNRVALVSVDDEELAAWLVLPAKPQVAAEGVVRGVVLQQPAGEHTRREPIIGARPEETCREAAVRQPHAIDRQAGLDRQLTGDRRASARQADRGDGTVVKVAM